jgi:hypothetical protein
LPTPAITSPSLDGIEGSADIAAHLFDPGVVLFIRA